MNITLHQRNQIQPLLWQQNMGIAQSVLMMIVASKSLRTIAARRFITVVYEMRAMKSNRCESEMTYRIARGRT